MGYTEQLYRAQDAALERALAASMVPPDDYYFEDSRNRYDAPEDEGEEDPEDE